ncbi:MAG: hypothetical protein IAA97_00955 [Spirochaetes bacterium]|uniref:Uncharacterized protein n=1 Tax=Candidatus Ornithospirochaeta stercoripullorum TaxID=2840899 RepID=A0A9D9DXL6_9SPIO|nr:hypothetical protein [Candidatus Ornithospirochaeta stercoripullorum]
MEEIKLDEVFDGLDGQNLFLNTLTERARKIGIQIGVPWTKNVYNYLFETTETDLEEIFGLVSDTSYNDMDVY